MSLGSSVTFNGEGKVPAWTVKETRVGSTMVTFLVMDGRCPDEYLHCTSPGLAEKRMNITYRWIRHHKFGCPLAAGVLGSLPACAQGSSVLGPGSGDSSVPELVYLGLLVVFVLRIVDWACSISFLQN